MYWEQGITRKNRLITLRKELIMNILIAGAGSQGLLLGAFLLNEKHNVIFLGRQNIITDLTDYGLRIVGKFGDFVYPSSSFSVLDDMSNFKESEKIDLVITTAKSFSSEQIAISIAPYISKDTPIIVFQNGIGVCEVYHRIM